MIAERKLAAFVTDCYFLEKTLKPKTRKWYLLKVEAFSRYLGRTAALADLNAPTINRFLQKRLDENAQNTARGERAILVSLWNWAHEAGEIEFPCTRVRLIKKQLKPVVGIDEHDLAKILAVTERWPGDFRNWPLRRSAFYTMVCWILWDTGLRLGDVRDLDSASIRGPGVIHVAQNKSGKLVPVPISVEAFAAMEAAGYRARRRFIGDVVCDRELQRQFAAILDVAGFHFEGARTKLLRRGSGSTIERDFPGHGHKHLGNGPGIFDAHYNVVRITGGAKLPPRPPRPS